jgi:outer membrane PBP1 activator LpoA protein
MQIQRSFVLLMCAWSLVACQGLLPRNSNSPSPPDDPEAAALLKSGDYPGATRRYEQLARTSQTPDHYWLEAADAALRSGDTAAAKNLASAIRPRELNNADNNRFILLTSRLDLNEGNASEALVKLDTLSGQKLTNLDERNYHILRASALNQLGDMLGSARERVALGKLLSRFEDVQRNNEVIYDALERVPDRQLLDQQPAPPDELGGWMALTHLLKTTPREGLPAAAAQWQSRYPGHPASGSFLQNALAGAGAPAEGAKGATASRGNKAIASLPAAPFVGVLLPLSGPYATAAQAIRTGMMAAQEADRDPGKHPLYFADSTTGNVYQNYRRLAEGGASAIVGPLVKDDVAALARGGDLPVPVLALNQVNDVQNTRLFQFGLTPEQEVEQVAGSAWFDGKQNALVLAPDTPFGKRLSQHFDRYWQSLGGRLMATRKYPQQGGDLTSLTREVPAGSGDAFIFLIADPKNAQIIVPKAMGTGLPVYATSHVYDGKSGEPANQPLDGLILCDMPWRLDPAEGGALSARSLESQISKMPSDSVKLVALGLDAYRLVPELSRMKADPDYRYAGATGTLAIQSGNRVQRQLECARFVGASPQRRGIAPLLKTPGTPSFSP